MSSATQKCAVWEENEIVCTSDPPVQYMKFNSIFGRTNYGNVIRLKYEHRYLRHRRIGILTYVRTHRTGSLLRAFSNDVLGVTYWTYPLRWLIIAQ